MNFRLLAALLVTLIVGLISGHVTAGLISVPVDSKSGAIRRFELHQMEYTFVYGGQDQQMGKALGVFRIDTATGQTTLYVAGENRVHPGLWQKIDEGR